MPTESSSLTFEITTGMVNETGEDFIKFEYTWKD